MPNVLSPRELDSRPDNMDETVLSSSLHIFFYRFANDYAESLYTISVPTSALFNFSHCPAFHDATFHSTLSYVLF